MFVGCLMRAATHLLLIRRKGFMKYRTSETVLRYPDLHTRSTFECRHRTLNVPYHIHINLEGSTKSDPYCDMHNVNSQEWQTHILNLRNHSGMFLFWRQRIQTLTKLSLLRIAAAAKIIEHILHYRQYTSSQCKCSKPLHMISYSISLHCLPV